MSDRQPKRKTYLLPQVPAPEFLHRRDLEVAI